MFDFKGDESSGGRVFGGDWEQPEDEEQQPRSIEFYGISRRAARFGSLTTGSLTFVLMSRFFIPALQPVGWIFLGVAVSTIALILALHKDPQIKLLSVILAGAVAIGAVLGSWDYVRTLFMGGDAILWQLGTLIVVLGIVMAIHNGMKRRNEDDATVL